MRGGLAESGREVRPAEAGPVRRELLREGRSPIHEGLDARTPARIVIGATTPPPAPGSPRSSAEASGGKSVRQGS